MERYVKILLPEDYESDEFEGKKIFRPTYEEVLDHGFVGLVDFMGDDESIPEAARVSYGKGTKKVNTNTGLVRYLMRHGHTSPVEMCTFKFHVKAPIFVFRQWHRHRTFSLNEYSARYSEMSDEMYMPNYDVLFPQSTSNKQGREGNLFTEEEYSTICSCIEEIFDSSYHTYKHILGPDSNGTVTPPPDSIRRRIDWAKAAALEAARTSRERALEDESENPYDTEEKVDNLIRAYLQQNGLCELNEDFPGISRELARIVLPVATYSQMYWTGNLHNLFHFLNLRSDSHAQHEIQVYANAILKLITPIVPQAVKAFEDYQLYANKFSRMENEVIKEHLVPMITEQVWNDMMTSLEKKGCSNREILEFKSKLGI